MHVLAVIPLTEAQLLALARAGDPDSIAMLYATHRDGALRFATSLVGRNDADDVVADAFASVVSHLQAGRGPTSNFRAYLVATIRNRGHDLHRRFGREDPVSHHPELLEHAVEVSTEPCEEFDDALAAAAFVSLPAPWRRILELVEMEERSIHEVGALLGLKPAAVSSLAYRAREGLRTAYLDQFLRKTAAATAECSWVRPRLSRYIRRSLGGAVVNRMARHLGACSCCSQLLVDLERVNGRFHLQLRQTPVATLTSLDHNVELDLDRVTLAG